MPSPLIEIKDIKKSFGNLEVLRGVNMSINRGEITAIIGKSGEGKSVLLKHIIGLLQPDDGEIIFEGMPFSKINKKQLRQIWSKFSYVFQGNALFDSITIYDNIALPLSEKKLFKDKIIREKVFQRMEQLDIMGIEGKYPSQISGGMKKRVALARALITDPETVLFDEPTTGLDPIRKNAVHSMISDYQKKLGFTCVLVSHEIPDVFYIAQKVAMLDEGKIIYEGLSQNIFKDKNENIQEFIRGTECSHDDLTGLPPKCHGDRRFSEEIARLEFGQSAFSIVILTFESDNETTGFTGHEAIQALIRDFASGINKLLRITDICSRYGMNKIMILMPNTIIEEAKEICADIAKKVNPVDLIGTKTLSPVRFSIGAGFAQADSASDIEKLFESAETDSKKFYEISI
ncbi:ATP-binding cassette domain-containing protein [Desulforegula conservatrix]|uniref:ATP-binding cassette domain-containing protein n=1 Tax=Desulforegula conservatrix TaxID=153026 RepID=UPI0003F5B010|nr:ATP-binding cassette domain-containing protein [Desulforegula conservatrix]